MTEAEIPVEDDQGELVHWFDRRPVVLSTAEASAVVLGAFGIGVLVALGALGLCGRLRT